MGEWSKSGESVTKRMIQKFLKEEFDIEICIYILNHTPHHTRRGAVRRDAMRKKNPFPILPLHPTLPPLLLRLSPSRLCSRGKRTSSP